jgi:hypothetical protein
MENAGDPASLQPQVSVRKLSLTVLACLLTMMALDLLLNAGVFAKLWFEPSPFLLPPEDLFRRLPLGYLAFLLQALVYVWLSRIAGAKTRRQGSLFGLKLGAVLNAAAVLGLRSGTTANWTTLLVGWLIGGTVLTVGACFMAGFASERGEKRALLSASILFVGALVLIAVLQSIGLVPAKHIG